MPQFIILYRERTQRPSAAPLACIRTTEDGNAAEAAVLRDYPGADVLWVLSTADAATAFHYYVTAGAKP